MCLILAHQYIAQLEHVNTTKVRDAVFGNVGTTISFRVGAEDAEFLEKEFQPDFMMNDFVNLPKYNFYVKLMIDGISSRPFSAHNIEPPKKPEQIFKDVIIENSRRQYSTPREIVEEKISGEWVSESGKIVEEKIFRRAERPLSQILKPKDMGEERFSSRPMRKESNCRPAPPPMPNKETRRANADGLRAVLDKALNADVEEGPEK